MLNYAYIVSFDLYLVFEYDLNYLFSNSYSFLINGKQINKSNCIGNEIQWHFKAYFFFGEKKFNAECKQQMVNF